MKTFRSLRDSFKQNHAISQSHHSIHEFIVKHMILAQTVGAKIMNIMAIIMLLIRCSGGWRGPMTWAPGGRVLQAFGRVAS